VSRGTKPAPPITAKHAKRLGYTIDTTCYPWVAYKGSRFIPDDYRLIKTPEWNGWGT
jgi:hypothetical protein